MRARSTGEGGFTLLESLIALSILAAVVMHFLGSRTSALIDAAEARNWRLAREIAASKMSELKAGANEFTRTAADLERRRPCAVFRKPAPVSEKAASSAPRSDCP